jgi:Ni,Fe-hydrogenase I cytochrome b subunit
LTSLSVSKWAVSRWNAKLEQGFRKPLAYVAIFFLLWLILTPIYSGVLLGLLDRVYPK